MCNNNMNGLNNDWKIYVKDACFFFLIFHIGEVY